MASGQRAPLAVLRPLAPEREDVEVAIQPALAPEDQKRACDLPLEVRLVVLEVDGRAGAVVLARRVDAGGVGEAALVLRERLRREEVISATAPRAQVQAHE